jgi:hypothetical protein
MMPNNKDQNKPRLEIHGSGCSREIHLQQSEIKKVHSAGNFKEAVEDDGKLF